MRGLPIAGKVCVMIVRCSQFVQLASFHEISFLCPALRWPDALRIVAAFFDCVDEVDVFDLFLADFVLAPDGDHAEPAIAAHSYSVPIPPESAETPSSREEKFLLWRLFLFETSITFVHLPPSQPILEWESAYQKLM